MSLLNRDNENSLSTQSAAGSPGRAPSVTRHIAEHFRGRIPDHENRAAAFYWERKRRLVLELIASRLPQLRANTPAGEQPRFVDIGSGEATDLFMIASYLNSCDPGWRFLGLEGFDKALEISERKNATYGIPGVDFRSANVTRPLPLDDRKVDVLYCSEVLEHIPEPGQLLSEFARVVRLGGYALITTPNEPNLLQRSWWSRAHYEHLKQESSGKQVVAESVVNGEPVKLYGHVSLHTNREWDRMLAQHGFSLVDFRRGAAVYGNRPFYRKPGFYQARAAAEWVLDLFPRSLFRNLSDQVIALYRRV